MRKPWVVSHAKPDPRGGYALSLFNRYTQRKAYWTINPRVSPLDARYDFTGATFEGEAESILEFEQVGHGCVTCGTEIPEPGYCSRACANAPEK